MTVKLKKQHGRYKQYLNTKLPWINEIPNTWKLLPIRAFTQKKSVNGMDKKELLSVYREYGVIKKSSRDDNHNVESDDLSNYKFVEKNDLVVNKMKAWQGSMGVSSYEGIVSPAYIICRLKRDLVSPRFVHYNLRAKHLIEKYLSVSYGIRIGQWDMHYEDFKKIEVTIPPLEEQTAIAKYLDQKIELLDRITASKYKQIELLKEKRAAIINQAVTKGLDENLDVVESGIDWIGKIPKGWEVRKLKYVSKIISGYSFNSEDYCEIGLPVVRIGDVGQEIDYENIKRVPVSLAKKVTKFKLVKGDILLALTGATIGKSSVFDNEEESYLNQRVAAIRSVNINSRYIAYCVHSEIFKEAIRIACFGGAQENIGTPQVGNIVLSLPPPEEQTSIAKFLDKQTANLDGAIEAVEKSIQLLNEYKSSLITNVVTGKVKVT